MRVKRSGDVIRFGQRVRELRVAAGMSQIELGKRAQLTNKFIGEIERGVTSPGLIAVFDLADALDCDPAVLFERCAIPRRVSLRLEDARRAAEALAVLHAVLRPRRFSRTEGAVAAGR